MSGRGAPPDADPDAHPGIGADSAGAVVNNPWSVLRRHTPARIGLGRAGVSQPTAPQLAFQAAHAMARDAVHRPLDHAAVGGAIGALGLAVIHLHSAAADRQIYLQRPDLGRRLDEASQAQLLAPGHDHECALRPPELALVVADGLSSLAIERHAAPFIAELLKKVPDWRLAPVSVVRQGRVAIGDPIGEALRVPLVVVLVGERPGLSSPDSMGLYVTWSPRTGRVDAERNCISNVRPEGLPLPEAARRLAWLLGEARARQLTGVALKDGSAPEVAQDGPRSNFLIG